MSELSKKELAKKILALADELNKRKDEPMYVVVRNMEMRQMVKEYDRMKANT